MKSSLNAIYVIHDAFRKESVSLSDSISRNKNRCDQLTVMITRRLLFESKADDVFWIHRLKNQKKITGWLLPSEKT